MNKKSSARLFFYLLIILSFIEALYFYQLMPVKTATHFNIYGQPDGWSSKSTILLINTAVVILFALIFRIIILFTPKIPEGLINLPNKHYWLSEKRKIDSYQKINNFLFWIGDITLLFFLLLFYLIYKSNINNYASISPRIWILMIAYLGVLSILTIKFYKYFNKIPDK
jgi:uncharacterized membrane protein